jgi:hypothetical protein
VRGWITAVLGADPTGLLPVWSAVMNAMSVERNTGTETGHYTLQFPKDLTTNPCVKYLHYETCQLSPAELPPVDRKANIEIVRTLFHELNRVFSCGLGPGVSLERTDDSQKKVLRNQ